MFDYTIQQGDYLSGIALMFDIKAEDILASNFGIEEFKPGLVIKIPVSSYLIQKYPWYIHYPELFIRYPRNYWDNIKHWPDNWRGSGYQGKSFGMPGCPGMLGEIPDSSRRIT